MVEGCVEAWRFLPWKFASRMHVRPASRDDRTSFNVRDAQPQQAVTTQARESLQLARPHVPVTQTQSRWRPHKRGYISSWIKTLRTFPIMLTCRDRNLLNAECPDGGYDPTHRFGITLSLALPIFSFALASDMSLA
jgi:hypothetical protein